MPDNWGWKLFALFVILFNVSFMYYAWQNGKKPRPYDYEDAIWRLERDVFYDHRFTIYCGVPFDKENRVETPDGFMVDGGMAPGNQFISWEHAMPVSYFGKTFPEWTEGHPECVRKGRFYKGRKCAEKMNSSFRTMEGDMYNLFPAIEAVNNVRGNKRYAELPDEEAAFGSCPAKISRSRFEPPDTSKGQVARAMLYMDARYPEARIDDKQRALMEKWDKSFPPDKWECNRAKRIQQIQGTENIFIKEQCEAREMW